jgi:hypothetical protein
MHPLFLLALITFVIVLGFAAWSLTAVKRQQKHGDAARGIGSPNDPMS